MEVARRRSNALDRRRRRRLRRRRKKRGAMVGELAARKGRDEERLRSDKSRFGSARDGAARRHFVISFFMTSGKISEVVVDEFYCGHNSLMKKIYKKNTGLKIKKSK